MPVSQPLLAEHMPRKTALLYLIAGVVWIVLSDGLLVLLELHSTVAARLQVLKGWLFVFGSAGLIYALLMRYHRRNERMLAQLLESQAQIRRMNSELEQRVADRTRQLETANRELESFAYAVSHDLRAPLRSLSGFSQILHDTALDSFDEKSRHYLERIHTSSARMSMLIDDLLSLSRISRSEMQRRPVDLSLLAAEAAASVRERYPDREVELSIAPNLHVDGDSRLLKIAMVNLLDNAWKYTAMTTSAKVTLDMQSNAQGPVYFVRDNGVGFDMAYAGKLFGPFQRLHTNEQFPGTGIGLVTVQRILARHGGRIWAEAALNQGATFYFTLGPAADA
jgi:light-regulated signal transduction histidine kinase (bacteriophytochrome)